MLWAQSYHESSYYKSCFLSWFIFHGHSTQEPASSRVTCLILRICTGTGVSHSQYRGKKIGRGFGKNAGEWTRRVEIRKKSLAVCIACMALYWPTPGFKGRTFKLCILTRWDFNFSIRSSPVQGHGGKKVFQGIKISRRQKRKVLREVLNCERKLLCKMRGGRLFQTRVSERRITSDQSSWVSTLHKKECFSSKLEWRVQDGER